MSLAGPAHPNWKGGVSYRAARYEEILGPKYREAFDRVTLELREDIGLHDTRLDELVQRVATQQPPWSELQQAFAALKIGMAAQNTASMAAALTQLQDLIQGGVAADRTWSQLIRQLEHKRKLVESERRRMVEANLFLTREQAAAYGHALLELVARNVTDKAATVRIVHDVQRLVAGVSAQESAE